MTNTFYTNQQFAETYHELVSHEDYEQHLLPALMAIESLKNKYILELGAGTGRVSSLIAPLARRLIATDLSYPMLNCGREHLSKLKLASWHICLANHLNLPLRSQSADVVLSGWSFHGVAIDYPHGWQHTLEDALKEVARVQRSGGITILIESLGTGYETPHTPDILVDYLDALDAHGFESSWIRTDYLFKDKENAIDLMSFFFGEAPMPMWETSAGIIVPECTGLWWKRFE